jgi:hypothetical protein
MFVDLKNAAGEKEETQGTRKAKGPKNNSLEVTTGN